MLLTKKGKGVENRKRKNVREVKGGNGRSGNLMELSRLGDLDKQSSEGERDKKKEEKTRDQRKTN